MAHAIFINLPVKDLDRSRAFYEALSFSLDMAISDETAARVAVSDTISVMLLTHPKMAQYTDLPIGDAANQTQHLLALSCESREAVDQMLDAGLKAGGVEARPVQDHGFMYLRTLADPDGHLWEPFWMEDAAVEPSE